MELEILELFNPVAQESHRVPPTKAHIQSEPILSFGQAQQEDMSGPRATHCERPR
jgi:hypothetical protein